MSPYSTSTVMGVGVFCNYEFDTNITRFRLFLHDLSLYGYRGLTQQWFLPDCKSYMFIPRLVQIAPGALEFCLTHTNASISLYNNCINHCKFEVSCTLCNLATSLLTLQIPQKEQAHGPYFANNKMKIKLTSLNVLQHFLRLTYIILHAILPN